ncbi:hypothetical protein ACL598_04245 [Bordetella bronchialis]|uniref:hypothetical protein n=1 Tax=Bordetella bronchialis TaxID=463025 RepID=UPI003D016F33
MKPKRAARPAAGLVLAVLPLACVPPALGAPAAPGENYTLRQALTAWDMLAKVDVLCPDGDGDRQARRLDELEAVATQRLKLSAKAMLEKLAEEVPPVLMTAEQAVRVVANAGGCKTEALAQWRGRAAFVADTSRQVLAGEARADRQWPRDAALERPLRITVSGQRGDPMHGSGVSLRVENRAARPVRFALLGPQTFVGLCTRLSISGVPVEQGYAPREWLTLPGRGDATVSLVRDPSCSRPPPGRVNVGGVVAVDAGGGARYWRFLVRGVGAAPAGLKP